MFVYLLFLLVFGVFLLRYESMGGRTKKLAILSSISILLFFSGLRGSVGSDTSSYLDYFHAAQSNYGAFYLFSVVEPGYAILTIVLAKISDKDWLFIFSLSAIQTTLLYYIYKKSTNKKFIFVYALIFYLNFHFNTLRAGTAALLVLSSIAATSPRSRTIFLLLAPNFHISVLAIYPFLFYKIIFKNQKLTALLLVSTLALAYFFGEVFIAKILRYDDYLQSQNSSFNIYLTFMTALCTFNAMIALSYSRPIACLAAMTAVFYIAAMFWPIFYRYTILGNLFYLYFSFEKFPNKINNRKFLLLTAPLVLILTAMVLWGLVAETQSLNLRDDISTNSAALDYTMIPYQFFWNDPLID